MDFDFCVVSDVEAFNKQIVSAFSVTTKPTLVAVGQFIREISAYLRSIVEQAGYDVDNIHAISGTASGTITAGNDVGIALGSGEGEAFTAGENLKIEGLSGNVKTVEFQVLKSKSGDTLTVTTVSNSYAAGAVVKQLNDAMRTLRHLIVLGVTLKIEKSIYSGTAPNISDRYQEIKEEYHGSRENQAGIWAIQNVEDFLRGASQTSEAAERLTIQSYGSEHETDDDVLPVIEKDMDF